MNEKQMSQDEILKSIRESLIDEKPERNNENKSVLSMIRNKLKKEKQDNYIEDLEEFTTNELSSPENNLKNIFQNKEDNTDDVSLPQPSINYQNSETIEKPIISKEKTDTNNLLNITVEELINKIVEPIVKKYIDENISELVKKEVKTLAEQNE